ncbi:hypothetical protein SXCC_02228 [Gluconacetobacter sp. SXCC-1]|nr:hypothetical protein SXCC_02228 [Gluconacetobacter sp. SXCC-1]
MRRRRSGRVCCLCHGALACPCRLSGKPGVEGMRLSNGPGRAWFHAFTPAGAQGA